MTERAYLSFFFSTFFIFFFIIIIIFSFFPSSCISTKTLTPTQSLTINQTLVSAGDVFELGFFTPDSSSGKWYVGIWYKKIPKKTYVWIANRDYPVTNLSPILKISNQTLVLLDQNKTIWFSNHTKGTSDIESLVVAELLDNGNFVLRGENNENPDDYSWQSFDYPTDTLLPEMKLGWDLKTGLNRFITSWRSTEDPSTGDFSFRLDSHGNPEVFLWNKKSIEYRSGPWNGIGFSGVPEMKPLNYIDFYFIDDHDKVIYSSNLTDKSVYSRLTVSPSGLLQRLTWINDSQDWHQYWYAPKDQCDNYKECGPYGICNSNDLSSSFVCNCAKGFDPKDQTAWGLRDGSGGCLRTTNVSCVGDKFLRLRNMKLPDTSTSVVNRDMSLKECEVFCSSNCSCTAYANTDVRNGHGCVTWSGELVDMRQYSDGGQDLYVRLAASDIGDRKSSTALTLSITISVAVFLLGLITCILCKRKALHNKLKAELQQRGASRERSLNFQLHEVVTASKREYSGEMKSEDLELFDFHTIETATDNFSNENKLGKGGFGTVYKGRMTDGQDIAVKRLSKTSGQGSEEFKNEVRLIARLQHRNLVRLLGCCIEINEKLLVYEYMENRSLDSILFDKTRSSVLNWQKRFNIICGTARGLLYLHQDSRFRIIHRDLKASNILLDGEMNPKISDFGMARIFGEDQTEANTRRVVGTYGYMSPEYAMDGLFSIKSDVFSFGVLVLEIVSGNKNRGFYNASNELNLLGHAWRLWKEGKGVELLDTSVGSSYPQDEVLRCIQVGLLCVQERAEDRPTMTSVVLMLNSETATISRPKTPGFCIMESRVETDSSSSKRDESCSVNHVTITRLNPRLSLGSYFEVQSNLLKLLGLFR